MGTPKNVALSVWPRQELTVSSRLPRMWRVDPLFRPQTDTGLDGQLSKTARDGAFPGIELFYLRMGRC